MESLHQRTQARDRASPGLMDRDLCCVLRQLHAFCVFNSIRVRLCRRIRLCHYLEFFYAATNSKELSHVFVLLFCLHKNLVGTKFD